MVRTPDARIALPLIRVATGRLLGVAVDMGAEGGPIGMLTYPQPTPPTAPPNGAHHRRTIHLVGAVPSAFVGPTPWWICGVAMGLAFFPPHSGTSRRSRYRGPSAVLRLRACSRWLGAAAAGCARSCDLLPTLPPTGHCSPPCTHPGAVRPLGWLTTRSPQRRSRYRDCRRGGSACSGNRANRAWSGERRAPAARPAGSGDSTSLGDGSNARSTGYSPSRPTTR
jgi:hypothetical protein